jgi:hypothetical protein
MLPAMTPTMKPTNSFTEQDNNPLPIDFMPETFEPLNTGALNVNEQNPISIDFMPETFEPLNAQGAPASEEYTGKHPIAAGAKNVIAGAAGAIPDLPIAGYNLFAKKENQVPYVTDEVANAIDKLTGGYTKDTSAFSKSAVRFASSLFGGGFLGKGLQLAGATRKLGAASDIVEKVGKGVSKLGLSEVNAHTVGAATAGATVAGKASEIDLPVYAEIPAVIGAMVLGGKGSGAIAGKSKELAGEFLKPLFEKVPGLQKFLEKQDYKELAQLVNPESIENLIKNALLEEDTAFLKEKTLSELPASLQEKIKKNPQSLTEAEVESVVKKGFEDFQNYVKGLEKEYGITLTTGEFSASPKVIAQEDALANKPNVEGFDVFSQNRRRKIIQNVENIKNNLSSHKSSAEDLGQKIAGEVEKVYKDAYQLRAHNWNKNFGDVADESIIPISNYVTKLKEFAKLNPDTIGNEVAIKAANKKLKQGIQYSTEGTYKDAPHISPKRVNEILVGHNEDLMRYPDRTFSRKQIGELKAALEADLDAAAQNATTSDQAKMIQKARSDYKTDSALIDRIDESILFNKIDKGTLSVPENIAKALNTMEPSQLKLTFDALKRSESYGNVISDIQRYYVEEALTAATKGGVENFNPRVFLEKLPKKNAFNVIFEGSNAHQEIREISTLLDRIRKYQPVRGNSKTAQRQQADRGDLDMDIAKAVGKGIKGNFTDALMTLKEAIFGKGIKSDEKIVEILTSPSKREEILKLTGKVKKESLSLPATAQTFKKERENPPTYRETIEKMRKTKSLRG